MAQLRESKKRETRQRISDVATGLFFERGFDAVTVDEIAVAAKVSKMTVFNYFARKEELLLDREDDLTLLPFRQALGARDAERSPVDALRAAVSEMSAAKHPLFHMSAKVVDWWRVVDASHALKARLRELADEATDALAMALAADRPDARVRLAAGIIVMTVRTAREESVRLMQRGASAKKANAALLALIEQGLSVAEPLLTTAAHAALTRR